MATRPRIVARSSAQFSSFSSYGMTSFTVSGVVEITEGCSACTFASRLMTVFCCVAGFMGARPRMVARSRASVNATRRATVMA